MTVSAMASNRRWIYRSWILIGLTTLWLLIAPVSPHNYDGYESHSSSPTSSSVHIELRRKRSLQWNGIELDANTLLGHLMDHERALIFGTPSAGEAPDFKLVHLEQEEEEENSVKRRRRRSMPLPQDADSSHGQGNGAEEGVEARLQLHQAPQLIDDAFIFIRRTANGTQFVEHSPQLLKRLESCFYRSPAAALDLCETGTARGVFQQNASDFVIHPLPARFGAGNHVIYQARLDRNNFGRLGGALDPLDSQLQFEPDAEEFNEPKPRLRAQTQSQSQSPLRLRFQPRHHHHHHQEKSQHENQRKNLKHHQKHGRRRRFIGPPPRGLSVPEELFIETAIFVDRDLFAHMQRNFPADTESKMISFVLAMINGVQLLYHHPTLGRRINFVLKRLEIWKSWDPASLSRSSDVDHYLNSFCEWQEKLNPFSDLHPLHYDHALILTGLDLRTITKDGKANSQVVGLAPVSGMCTPVSSCTINEAKHFESVFVVAHEIGHNLGMRHDTKENSCDPSMHIMSPKLGSGKVTWSKCSRTYLEDFLLEPQAECLFDRGQFLDNLDHSAGGIPPGERFDANQQCMLRFGKNFMRASSQSKAEICRDLHCRQDKLPWTSHPALEGTECGERMWCRGGSCVARSSQETALASYRQWPHKPSYEKASFMESNRIGPLLSEQARPSGNELPGAVTNWSAWSEGSKCESECLYGPSNRLREGSTGLRTFNRSCLNYRQRCMGQDRRFESCIAKQCYSVPVQTIANFATQVCMQAKKLDGELTGEGQQVSSTFEDSCKVFCRTRTNATKSRRWTFPDGTTCRSKHHSAEDIAYCISGRCERFSCDNSTNNFYRMDQTFCQSRARDSANEESRQQQQQQQQAVTQKRYAEKQEGVTPRNRFENEVAVRSFYGQDNHIRPQQQQQQQQQQQPQPHKRKVYESYHKYPPREEQPQRAAPPPASASLIAIDRSSSAETEWEVKSGCHSNCMADSKGIQAVRSRVTREETFQLCTHRAKPCERLQTAAEYAEQTCASYRMKVRGLSGHGAQISASMDEPDRSCRVGCQDEFIKYRYYLVNGKNGHFPMGTRCSQVSKRFCVYGKCLEFGDDNLPLEKSHISLALLRTRREALVSRRKRSFQPASPFPQYNIERGYLHAASSDHIEFTHPIHVSADELSSKS
ncbi:A disintegrin and metalloproteinase with thrombospondin motifs 16 [Drosophila obscura]|uniref:A disintegrin and metalloproteinase with thrombospondin motifs 16 n=1 Tax=Drosophila obscura TaxID=7282 RepID=UPI001BB2CF23|nr:A disintegrin and metalloproteinase with thrombospondin motifs 16 [Drosophila obscura]XP_022227614.2 A disintegrin and metalloproteinase with thrombospondin motifs 16 [Drosophila obscura]